MYVLSVAFTTEPAECPGHLCYAEGEWRREVDCEFFHVEYRRRLLRPDSFVVMKSAGADTAAIGGGTVWYDQIGPDYSTEQAAIQAMMEIMPLQRKKMSRS